MPVFGEKYDMWEHSYLKAEVHWATALRTFRLGLADLQTTLRAQPFSQKQCHSGMPNKHPHPRRIDTECSGRPRR
jgi:hypothetical protein